MQHDLRLLAAARAIYDACYPTEELAPVGGGADSMARPYRSLEDDAKPSTTQALTGV